MVLPHFHTCELNTHLVFQNVPSPRRTFSLSHVYSGGCFIHCYMQSEFTPELHHAMAHAAIALCALWRVGMVRFLPDGGPRAHDVIAYPGRIHSTFYLVLQLYLPSERKI